MAKEIRRLIFSYAESGEAIKSYAQSQNINFPKGKIVRTQFAESTEYEINPLRQMKSDLQDNYNVKDDSKAVILTIFSEETLEQKYFNLTASFICTALIEYCIKHKIMIPKDSEKSLGFSDFSICIDINKDAFTDADKSTDRLSLAD